MSRSTTFLASLFGAKTREEEVVVLLSSCIRAVRVRPELLEGERTQLTGLALEFGVLRPLSSPFCGCSCCSWVGLSGRTSATGIVDTVLVVRDFVGVAVAVTTGTGRVTARSKASSQLQSLLKVLPLPASTALCTGRTRALAGEMAWIPLPFHCLQTFFKLLFNDL
jgi:hypothetical protein